MLRFFVKVVAKEKKKFKYTFWIGVVRLAWTCPKFYAQIYQEFSLFCWFRGIFWRWSRVFLPHNSKTQIYFLEIIFIFTPNIITVDIHKCMWYKKIEYHNVTRILLLKNQSFRRCFPIVSFFCVYFQVFLYFILSF